MHVPFKVSPAFEYAESTFLKCQASFCRLFWQMRKALCQQLRNQKGETFGMTTVNQCGQL